MVIETPNHTHKRDSLGSATRVFNLNQVSLSHDLHSFQGHQIPKTHMIALVSEKIKTTKQQNNKNDMKCHQNKRIDHN